MRQVVQAPQWTVVGRYELMGVNGSLLPAPIDPERAREGEEGLRASIIAGELRLDAEGEYRLSLTARIDTATGGGYTKALTSRGAWRFLASALDPTSGAVLLTPPEGPTTSAAVTGVSLVHRTRGPGPGETDGEANWIYVRHWQTP
ncbi:MAG TPA: hypothetical protein VJQ44_00805 [Gemmatimonadales bacterium]|nr:hypothetical protein [Gemmatimonadales bacterium]